MGLSVKLVRVDNVLAWDLDVTEVTRQQQSGWLQKETLPFCFWEALLEEECVVRVWGCTGDHKNTIPFGIAGLKKSNQKVCRGGGSRSGPCGRSTTAEGWTIFSLFIN